MLLVPTTKKQEVNICNQVSGIPSELALFDVFWEQITELMETRPEFTIEDTSSLLLSSCRLASNCYPEKLEYIDCVLGLAQTKIIEARRLDA